MEFTEKCLYIILQEVKGTLAGTVVIFNIYTFFLVEGVSEIHFNR